MADISKTDSERLADVVVVEPADTDAKRREEKGEVDCLTTGDFREVTLYRGTTNTRTYHRRWRKIETRDEVRMPSSDAWRPVNVHAHPGLKLAGESSPAYLTKTML